MRVDSIREEVLDLVNRRPFDPFEINLENGDRIVVEHPENIAFATPKNGSGATSKFFVITHEITIRSTFDAVTSVAEIDRGRPLDKSEE
jgi:hypothetical protein